MRSGVIRENFVENNKEATKIMKRNNFPSIEGSVGLMNQVDMGFHNDHVHANGLAIKPICSKQDLNVENSIPNKEARELNVVSKSQKMRARDKVRILIFFHLLRNKDMNLRILSTIQRRLDVTMIKTPLKNKGSWRWLIVSPANHIDTPKWELSMACKLSKSSEPLPNGEG